MKVVVISSNTSWYLYNFRKNTIVALLNNGYKVIAVSPKDDYSIKLLDLGAEHVDLGMDQGGANPVSDLRTFFQFFLIYRRYKPSVALHFTPKNNIYGTLAASLTGVKSINNIAGLGMVFINEGFTSKIARLLYRISQPRASKIFFQNEEDRQLFKANQLASLELSDRLPGSGADLSRFTLKQAPDDGVVRFLLVARMIYDKGIQQYVDAARTLKSKYGENIEFRLIGFLDVNNPSAVSRSQMESWVSEGIVQYRGVSDCIEKEIAEVDCMVLPSFYREGVPKSLLEAGAMGKPILTTDNVGCRETVDEGVNGFLCQPRSTESLIEKLELMFNLSHQQRLELGVASRRKIELEFDEQLVIEKYLSAVNECFK